MILSQLLWFILTLLYDVISTFENSFSSSFPIFKIYHSFSPFSSSFCTIFVFIPPFFLKELAFFWEKECVERVLLLIYSKILQGQYFIFLNIKLRNNHFYSLHTRRQSLICKTLVDSILTAKQHTESPLLLLSILNCLRSTMTCDQRFNSFEFDWPLGWLKDRELWGCPELLEGEVRLLQCFFAVVSIDYMCCWLVGSSL